MQTYRCPSCGADIKFQSPVSVTCICPYCRSLVVRHDKNVDSIGKMAELPDDVSPFQLGTEGVYKGTRFSLIGRMVIGWEEGRWSEWFMHVDDGRRGWLAEAQGFLAVSFEEPLPDEAKARLRKPMLGAVLRLGRAAFSIADVKEAQCIGSDGELPLLASTGRKTTSVDLVNRDGGFASVEFAKDSAEARCYIGEYVEFDQLRFIGLRELPGWKMPLSPKPSAGSAGHG
jgi:Domain of unknown function (DUF4178)